MDPSMKVLLVFWIALIGNVPHCVQSNDEFTEEWRMALCRLNDPQLYHDLNECFKLESKMVQESCKECAFKATSASKGDLILFMKEACNDHSVFDKFDECFLEFQKNEEFNAEPNDDQAEVCYEAVMDKYHLNEDSLRQNSSSKST